MTQEKKWWENRALRSVDNLKLWQGNPRLDPSSKLSSVRDYAEELISDDNDAQSFLALVKSIATRGFESFDPIVVWQNEDNDFVVAEGNRRVLALKLLRAPDRAPLSIRRNIVSLSRLIDREEIEKIRVCIAPSYDDSKWYILQRHSTASNTVRWQRLQQQRYIISIFDSVGEDIEETINITGFKRSAIIEALRYVKLRDIATQVEVTQYLTTEEKEIVYSHRINMTVLERWFGNSKVRSDWFVDFNEDGVSINADLPSFYYAYAQFLKLTINKKNELGYIVNTRTIDTHFEKIFDYLPKVQSRTDALKDNTSTENKKKKSPSDSITPYTISKEENKNETKTFLKGNPKRRQFTDQFHEIKTKSYKLKALFKELQSLPIYSYPNVSGAAIRIFLELAIDEYITNNELNESLSRKLKKAFSEITLSQKLSALRSEHISEREANKVIDQLLNHSNDHSLNTLNEYIHGIKVHKVEPQFLNGFWDMLSPLFKELIDFDEI